MSISSFIITGDPVPKARARVAYKGGVARAYTPEATKTYADTVHVIMKNNLQRGLVKKIPRPDPVELRLHFFVSSKVTSVPDIVNLAALIADALQHICYDNDSQITKLECLKTKSNKPRVQITVSSAVSYTDR